MRLTNRSYLPSPLVVQLAHGILLKAPVEPDVVNIQTSFEPFYGECTPGEMRIHVAIGTPQWFPCHRKAEPVAGYCALTISSPEEALRYTLAHELRHLWQWWNPGLPRLDGSTARQSERDADLWALEILHGR